MESTLAPTRVKRQHYVPQMYQRAFAHENGRIVTVHDLQDDRSFDTSMANVAVGHRFYDIEGMKPPMSAEDWLAKGESAAAPVLGRLVENPSQLVGLSSDEEVSLAQFLVTLYLRGPSYREGHQRRVDDVMAQLTTFVSRVLAERALASSGAAEPGPSLRDRWWATDEEFRADARLTANILAGAAGFANLLRTKPWRIGYVPHGTQLYTSDNPMSWWIKPVRPRWEHGALDYLDFWIALSPRVLLRLGRTKFSEEALRTGNVEPQGPREFRDSTEYETSVARHVISLRAARFLIGDALPVSRACARDCIARIEEGMRITADEFGARRTTRGPTLGGW